MKVMVEVAVVRIEVVVIPRVCIDLQLYNFILHGLFSFECMMSIILLDLVRCEHQTKNTKIES